jgi:predicted DsbA family dithiol-disulfide isomerase
LAHALVLGWPGSSSTKNPLIERIYQAYLSERKNIGETSVLVEISGRFGVSEKGCRAVLKNTFAKELDQHRAEAMQYRFPGMPAYRFRKQTLFGALSIEEWRRVLKSEETSCSTR